MLSFSLAVTRMDMIRNDYIRGTVHVLEIKPKRPIFHLNITLISYINSCIANVSST